MDPRRVIPFPTPASRAIDRLQPRLAPEPLRGPRNLVVLRAGDASLHREWIAEPRRDFDLFISYAGKLPGRHAGDGEYYEQRAGPKWPALAALLRDHADLVARYEAVWFPDDDLSVGTVALNRMFAFFCAHALHLAQPARSRNSFHVGGVLLQDPGCELRYTSFVEVSAPLFSREALAACAPSFAESESGWGLDEVWPVLCRREGLQGFAVIDATPVWHTRTPNSGAYGGPVHRNPREEAQRVFERFAVREQELAGRAPVLGRVERVWPSPAQRLARWLGWSGPGRAARRR